jgi:hypothetical protein
MEILTFPLAYSGFIADSKYANFRMSVPSPYPPPRLKLYNINIKNNLNTHTAINIHLSVKTLAIFQLQLKDLSTITLRIRSRDTIGVQELRAPDKKTRFFVTWKCRMFQLVYS